MSRYDGSYPYRTIHEIKDEFYKAMAAVATAKCALCGAIVKMNQEEMEKHDATAHALVVI